MEPAPGRFELDDFDRFFELAARHDLLVWFDLTLATHGACPDWLLREHPDIRQVKPDGTPLHPDSTNAMPQGRMIHCYDHPKWREYGERLLRTVVGRYRDHESLLIWGVWDGASFPTTDGPVCPCYCASTLDRYAAWLKRRYTLEELNERLHRRYRCWEDVAPPRSSRNVVEMLLYRQFHVENLAETLRWQVQVIRELDARHELRAHGANMPRLFDQACAREVDSWGMSMPSNELLTGPRPPADRRTLLQLRLVAQHRPRRPLVERGDLRRHEPGRRHLEAAVAPDGGDLALVAEPHPRRRRGDVLAVHAGVPELRGAGLQPDRPGPGADGAPARGARCARGHRPHRRPPAAAGPGPRGGDPLRWPELGDLPLQRRAAALPRRSARSLPHAVGARHSGRRDHERARLVAVPRGLAAEHGAAGGGDGRPDRRRRGAGVGTVRGGGRQPGLLRGERTLQLCAAGGTERAAGRAGRRLRPLHAGTRRQTACCRARSGI